MVAENDNLSDVKIEDIQLEGTDDKPEELACPFALSCM